MSLLSPRPTNCPARSLIEEPTFFLLIRTFLDHQALGSRPDSPPASMEIPAPLGTPPEAGRTEDGTFYNVRFRQLGRHVEAYYSPLGWYVGRSAGPPAPRSASRVLGPEEQAVHRRRADQRARSQLRRLVLAYRLQHLWTLTFAAPVTGLAAAWQEFTTFIRRARRRWGRFDYVAVASVQTGRAATAGAPVWHFHLAVRERRSADELAELWPHGRAWARPFLDNNRRPHPIGLANYLCKNLTEAASERVKGRRYRAAQGMRIETVDGTVADEDELSQRLGALEGHVVSFRPMTDWNGVTVLLECPAPATAPVDPFAALCQSLGSPAPPPSTTPVETAAVSGSSVRNGERGAGALSPSNPPPLFPDDKLHLVRQVMGQAACPGQAPLLVWRAGAASVLIHVYQPQLEPTFTNSHLPCCSLSYPVRLMADRGLALIPNWPGSPSSARPVSPLRAPLRPAVLSPRLREVVRSGKLRGHRRRRAARTWRASVRPRGP